MEQKKKHNKLFNLRLKITKLFMLNGKKNKGETTVLKFIKKLQKSNKKCFKFLIQFAIINSIFIFKINEQTVPKNNGSKKNFKNKIFFIITDSFRIIMALKSLKYTIKNKNSNRLYENVVNEILIASNYNGQSINKKIELLKKIVTNRRYFSKITFNRI